MQVVLLLAPFNPLPMNFYLCEKTLPSYYFFLINGWPK